MSELPARIEALLTERTGGPVKVRDLRPLTGGACQDNYRVDLIFGAGELEGERRLALRSDAKQGLPASLTRAGEFAVVEAAVAAGVRTPRARWLSSGLVRDGADAYFLDWVEGEAIGRRVVRNPELAAARKKLPDELAEVLARIHSVTAAQVPSLAEEGRRRSPMNGGARANLAYMRRTLEGLKEPHPVLELCLAWLTERVPTLAPGAERLVHGDFRTGNFLVQPSGLAAVLDWEFAHVGDPDEDLGWLCQRDWRFGQLALPVGGFAERQPFYDAYSRASGRAVEPKRVLYWEVMGNVQWALGSIHQGERYLSGEETDLELVAVARRAVEMEYEALRLIERSG